MGRRAFTLIELLVVIAIIATMSSLVMPALGTALSQARATSCSSRLAQIGYALQMYCIDHGEYLPGQGDSDNRYYFGRYNGSSAFVDFSDGYLSDYVGNDAEVWQCPGFRDFMPRASGPTAAYAYNYEYLTKYEDNGLSWFDPNYRWTYPGLPLAIIRKSTSLALFGDSARNWMGPLEENWYWTPPSQSIPYGVAYTHFRHRLRANILWADGHVSSMPPDKRVPLDQDNLGVICDESDRYFDPDQ
jgi:prepilin-type N-terminal cleavage/methylation domain-containing protein/prepilin-type processing-associated H-X9-DG protein